LVRDHEERVVGVEGEMGHMRGRWKKTDETLNVISSNHPELWREELEDVRLEANQLFALKTELQKKQPMEEMENYVTVNNIEEFIIQLRAEILILESKMEDSSQEQSRMLDRRCDMVRDEMVSHIRPIASETIEDYLEDGLMNENEGSGAGYRFERNQFIIYFLF